MNKIEVLDSGYVQFVESYGKDESIIEAARMSTNKGFKGWGHWIADIMGPDQNMGLDRGTLEPSTIAAWEAAGRPDPFTKFLTYSNFEWVNGDENLLKYLYSNKHFTPFEMAGLIIEVKAPIFVFREWHRHRTQSYNEMSARYIPLPNENYSPSIERIMINADNGNKQAGTVKGSEVLEEESAKAWKMKLDKLYQDAENFYQDGLRRGIPKELARVCVPVGRYSVMRASANLRNWLAFLSLRMDPAAQWEIRQFANAVGSIIEVQFPRTWELFMLGKK